MRPAVLIGIAVLSLPLIASAQHEHHMGAVQRGTSSTAKPAAKTAVDSVAGKQLYCPVDGKPVTSGATAEWKGQKIAFCSAGDAARFQRTPEAYLPNLYAQLYPQRTQVVCPVMGNEINPKVFTEHNGQKVFFCCPGCDKKYEADPPKYAAKLQAGATEQVHCPIDGKPVDPRYSSEGDDRKTYFCSEACAAQYNQNEKAYAEAALPETGRIAAGATPKDDLFMCPVDGSVTPRSATKSLAYQGKLYFFDKPECVEAFKAAPDKYIAKLQTAVRASLARVQNTVGRNRPANSSSKTESGGRQMKPTHGAMMGGSGHGASCH